MQDLTTEERYPLLLLYVEEGSKGASFPGKVTVTNRNRGKSIISGTAAIIHQWPEHVATCWMIAIAVTFLFMIFSLLFLTFTMNPANGHLRCSRSIEKHYGNRTIHLVHRGNVWDNRQKNILRLIATVYPEYEIHLILFENNLLDNNTNLTNPNVRLNDTKNFNMIGKHESDTYSTTDPRDMEHYFENLFLKKLINKLKRSIIRQKSHYSFEDILNEHKNIDVHYYNFQNYFKKTPLHSCWTNLDTNMLLFAARVHELWQYGGISFEIPSNNKDFMMHHLTNNNITKQKRNEGDNSLVSIIKKTKENSINLKENLVSIDEHGFHMATITPCHTFFENIFMDLQTHHEHVSVNKFIRNTLDVFCKRHFLLSSYCTVRG